MQLLYEHLTVLIKFRMTIGKVIAAAEIMNEQMSMHFGYFFSLVVGPIGSQCAMEALTH